MIRTNRVAPVKKMITDINITPFTDVILVLLIIFMVTYPALQQEADHNIKLPKTVSGDVPQYKQPAVVRITNDQRIYLNNSLTSLDKLQGQFKELHDKYETRLIVVKADESIPYRLVITTVDMARLAGLDQVGLAARQEKPVTAPVVAPDGSSEL